MSLKTDKPPINVTIGALIADGQLTPFINIQSRFSELLDRLL
jgi:hypothetical protein